MSYITFGYKFNDLSIVSLRQTVFYIRYTLATNSGRPILRKTSLSSKCTFTVQFVKNLWSILPEQNERFPHFLALVVEDDASSLTSNAVKPDYKAHHILTIVSGPNSVTITEKDCTVLS